MGLDKLVKDKLLGFFNSLQYTNLAPAERPVLSRLARTEIEPQRGDLFDYLTRFYEFKLDLKFNA